MSHQPQINISHFSFLLPNGTALFTEFSHIFSYCKTGLVGRNGIGKSTLIRLVAGEIKPNSGSVNIEGTIHYVPQITAITDNQTVADMLDCAEKIAALQHILNGSIDEHDYEIIGDDWNIKERVREQLAIFGLDVIPLDRPAISLSGGEITRLQLIKAFLSDADFLLLDEPTNHLDASARQQLYTAIKDWKKGLIVISHDRALLNLMDEIVELSKLGAKRYGGNYDSYHEQKSIEVNAAQQMLQARKEIADKAKKKTQLRKERHEQNEAKGRRKKSSQIKEKGSYNKIELKSAKGRSERTNRRIIMQSERQIEDVESQLQVAREKIEVNEEINVSLPKTRVPNSKIIVKAEKIYFNYPDSQRQIISNFNFRLHGPERIAIAGNNGSGKTTLIKLILRELQPKLGSIELGTEYISYLDQNASLLSPELSVLDNFMRFNPDKNTNAAHANLAQFLFRNTTALKLAKHLSGGEKLRALLACVLMSEHPPQLLILDEPTNHLDLSSIESIESILKNYQGAMIVISHDQEFLKNIGVETSIHAPFTGS